MILNIYVVCYLSNGLWYPSQGVYPSVIKIQAEEALTSAQRSHPNFLYRIFEFSQTTDQPVKEEISQQRIITI